MEATYRECDVKKIAFDREKCFNCDLCADVCSLHKLGRVQPHAAAIRIRREEGRYLGSLDALVCDEEACSGEHDCVRVCPAEALEYDEEAGVVRFEADLCTECMECVEACENVSRDPISGRIMICDTCDGEARCIEWCPEGALTLEER